MEDTVKYTLSDNSRIIESYINESFCYDLFVGVAMRDQYKVIIDHISFLVSVWPKSIMKHGHSISKLFPLKG